jgi:two-component system, OmpR family, sensor kinase ParS
MGVLYGLAVLVWVWPFWKDLKKLMRTADEIGAGRLDGKVRLRRGSPLMPLASSFNAMTQRIATLIESHRSLTNAVSHELRTPLARLRFGLSLAQEDQTAQGKDRYLARMDSDVDELDSLVAEMLAYAKMERGDPAIRLEAVPVRPWLDKLLEVAQREANGGGQSVSIRTQVSVGNVSCEARYMARAVANLVRNALRYAKKTVEVTVQQSANKTYIHVDDDGPGIAPAERERVFEPFTRLDQSRARASGGVGLGLAIVMQVAKWHRGGVSVSDSPLGGARVTISW